MALDLARTYVLPSLHNAPSQPSTHLQPPERTPGAAYPTLGTACPPHGTVCPAPPTVTPHSMRGHPSPVHFCAIFTKSPHKIAQTGAPNRPKCQLAQLRMVRNGTFWHTFRDFPAPSAAPTHNRRGGSVTRPYSPTNRHSAPHSRHSGPRAGIQHRMPLPPRGKVGMGVSAPVIPPAHSLSFQPRPSTSFPAHLFPVIPSVVEESKAVAVAMRTPCSYPSASLWARLTSVLTGTPVAPFGT